ncbi:MAG: MBOAT family protein, partial [Leptospira sp.]|nr:MBOAT family protein [Leptospira sp.]
MNFTTPLFLFFFLTVFVVRWAIPPVFGSSEKIRNNVALFSLVVFSYVFYMAWDYRFGLLLLFTTTFDYSIGRLMDRASQEKKKFFLITTIVVNLSILGFFKYFNFFLDNIDSSAKLFGLTAHIPALRILLPAGISFFTFQSMSYTIDVYRGVMYVEKRFLRYALFLSFFPQLVAGPIVQAKDFLPQLQLTKHLKDVRVGRAVYFLLLGFIKKSVIADQISAVSDFVFTYPGHLSSAFVWMGVISYSIQIYCDFSGYSDIARGLALSLGYELPENFNLPYFSRSLTDFWRRWHISLSGWLKSYLYIPLGGNKYGALKTYRNLMITMLLGGLWHGASWNFVFWGGIHGLYLSIERLFSEKFGPDFSQNSKYFPMKILKIVYPLFIFLLVTLLWVFFRSGNINIAFTIFHSLFSFKSGAMPDNSMLNLFYMAFSCVFLAHI